MKSGGRELLDRALDIAHQSPVFFGATSDEAKAWATARYAELDDGKLHTIVHALRPHAGSSAEAAKCMLYISRNRARMRYPKFHAQALCTSTGVLEAGAKY